MATHKVPRGMARHALLSGWGFPIWYLIPVLGVPIAVGLLTRNVFWLVLIIGTAPIARAVAGDVDTTRRKFLRFYSGSMFATRKKGVEVIYPWKPDNKGWGILHD